MITVIGAVGKTDANKALKVTGELAKKWKLEVVLFNAELVFGSEHLVAAYEHAKRAFESNTNTAKNLVMETLLYASGERQISKAIEKIGIKEGLKKLAIAFVGRPTGTQISELLSALKMKRNDNVLLPTGKNPRAFGITKKELGTVPKEKRCKLVLEKVAFVDLVK